MKIVGISGSISSPSRTTELTRTIVERLAQHPRAEVQLISIADLAPALGTTTDPRALPAVLSQAFARVAVADVLVVASPVYKASYSGLLKHFFDLLDPDALIGTTAVLAATGGSDRHALMLDHQLRPLLSYFNAYTIPTGIFLKDTDFVRRPEGGYELHSSDAHQRIERIAEQVFHSVGIELVANGVAA